MNNERFIIVDDDFGICQMLSNIIEDNDLGEVIDSFQEGELALSMIPKFRPDIVFMDLLLPDLDGIQIVKALSKKYPEIDFIMISQVSDYDMITEAYESGIEFYISKPINMIEVVTVTKRVIESQRNRRMLAQIGNTLNQNTNQPYKKNEDKDMVYAMLTEIGIVSEKGAEDLVTMILEARRVKRFQMSQLYATINTLNANKVSEKAIEQRTRRMIHTALINLATVGIEDFGNYRFDKYSNTLFSFKDVKKVMDALRKNEPVKATINIKQFISGAVAILERNS